MEKNATRGESPFRFKQFEVYQDRCAMKVGTDGVLLGAWAGVEGASRILDIGAGTGVIAIMAAQRAPLATVHAVEIDGPAFVQCGENMRECPWHTRLEVFHAAVQDYAKDPLEKYDLVLSNPPFFTGGTFSSKGGRSDVRHTVKLPHGELLQAARRLLAPSGRLALILPYIEGLRFLELAQGYNFYCMRMTEVRPKADKPIERLLMEFGQESTTTPPSGELIIQHDGVNAWTDAYRALTRDFYLDM
ncbi:MAG: tRNA1(Val) (adenine(37)-N6)-methyltransferase [Saprospiraceae bacterium]|jgi:tRNA1Val (adenine37-N6)-methyltransferase